MNYRYDPVPDRTLLLGILPGRPPFGDLSVLVRKRVDHATSPETTRHPARPARPLR